MAVRLGAFVRARRQQLGFQSMRSFARHAGVDDGMLSRLESGQQEGVSDENLARIAQGLGITVLELRRQTDMLSPEELNRAMGLPSVEDAVKVDPNLTEDQREILLAIYYSYVPAKRGQHDRPAGPPRTPR